MTEEERNAKRETEIADPLTLCDRLRGIYNIPINDGLGPIDGSMVFTREFRTPPIQYAAAARIEALEAEVQQLLNQIEGYAEQAAGDDW